MLLFVKSMNFYRVATTELGSEFLILLDLANFAILQPITDIFSEYLAF